MIPIMMKPELLMPAGDLEKCKISYQFGADACYGSTSAFSMRTREVGFTLATLKQAIIHAHTIGKKFYVPINIFPNENELPVLKKHIKKIVALKPDAIIVADLGILHIAKQQINKRTDKLKNSIELHLSTQANAINSESIKVYKKLGVKRIILAREVSLNNIKKIRANTPKNIELEAFVHGAMCMSVSGRCHLSNYMTGRDANHGQCTQVCRWNYSVKEKKRPNQYFDVEEDERYSYIFNAKDLCMIEHLDKLMNAGISSFKIEGRNKSIYYCAVVARAYRMAIDNTCHSEAMPKNPGILRSAQDDTKKLRKELDKVTSRGYSTGFFFKKPTQNDTEYKTSRPTSNWQFVGIVTGICHPERPKGAEGSHQYLVEGRNEIKKNSNVEILTPTKIYRKKLTSFEKPNSDSQEKINPGYEFVLDSTEKLPINSILRIKR